MRQIRIVIRYYDERGEVVFEGPPTLGHAYRVPLRWTRWEIYWDEALVEAGERKPHEAPVEASAGGLGGRRRPTESPARRSRDPQPQGSHYAVGAWLQSPAT